MSGPVRCDAVMRVLTLTVLGVLTIVLLLVWPAPASATSARIIMDGEFSDWDALDPVAVDPAGGTVPGALNLTRLWLANDERYLFICLEFTQEINIQSDNQIKLFLDTDDDAATGVSAHGLGAELVWTFGARSGIFTYASGSAGVEHAQVDIVTAPTVTSKRFEISFDRSAMPANSVPLFGGPTLRVVIEDASGKDVIPDQTGGVAYTFDETHLDPLPSLSLARRNGGDLRILTYNVLFDGYFDSAKRPSFDRLIRGLNPDIIGFEEIYDHSASQTQSRVASALPGQWYSSKVGADIIAVSRYPITRSFTVSGNGAFLINLRPAYDKDLLLIVAHTPCCSNESGRQREIDAFMAFIRDAKAPGGTLDLVPETPIVIVGDMNLVGYRQQLETILTGDIVNTGTYGPPFSPDWDGTDLENAAPRHTDLPMTFTWKDDGSSFWPGRLDYIVYTGSVMDMGNTFVAYTPAMPADTLAAYGLEAQDAVRASDHIPVVADFALPTSVAGLRIHCLDVGYGDCTLITSPTGGTFLLDAGSDGKGDEVVVPYLESLGLTALDYICATSYEPELIGDIDEVVEHLGIDSIRVAVLDRGSSIRGETFEKYAQSVSGKRTSITRGESIDLGGGVTITCVAVNGNGLLTPPYDGRYDEADLSIALVVEYMGFEFFVAGDLSGTDIGGHSDIESTLALDVGDVDVYRVSDHGGRYSSSEGLVSALLPEVAIISVGDGAPHDYPDQQVIDRLTGYGAYIYQTEHGTAGRIPGGSGQIVGGNVVLSVTDRTYTVNGSAPRDIEEDGIAIASLNADNADGEPLLLGQRVRVRGVATVGSGTFSTANNDVFVQDVTGGVNVFQQGAVNPIVKVGDKVEVNGFVDVFAGLTRITSPTIEIEASDINLPDPVAMSSAQVASSGGAREGSLIRLDGVYITSGTWPAVGSDGTITVDDGSGGCALFIDKDTDLPGAFDIPDTFDVVGILTQYDTTFPYLSGYRVTPRSTSDIVPSHHGSGGAIPRLVARILPNPTRGNLRVVFTRAATDHVKRVALYDVRGRKVGEAESPRGMSYLDWAPGTGSGGSVASGVYFAVVRAAGREETFKIVIMR